MGRPKKNEVVYDEDAVVGIEVPKPEVMPVKKVPYSLHAWYAYIDKEGFKIKAEYKSEGDTVTELLANIIPEWPKGCNRLVNVTVKHGDFEYARAVAPHVAREILEHKNEVTFNKLFKE